MKKHTGERASATEALPAATEGGKEGARKKRLSGERAIGPRPSSEERSERNRAQRKKDEEFSHVMQALISEGIHLTLDKSNPNSFTVGAPETAGPAERIRIGDVSVVVHDAEARKIIKRAKDEILTRELNEMDFGILEKPEAAAPDVFAETISKEQARLAEDEKRFTNLISSERPTTDLASWHDLAVRRAQYAETVLQGYQQELRSMPEVPPDEPPVPEVVRAIVREQTFLQDELERLLERKGPSVLSKRQQVSEKLSALDERLSAVRPEVLERYQAQVRRKREFDAYLAQERARGMAEEKTTNLLGDYYLLEAGLAPPRLLFTRRIYKEKLDAQEALEKFKAGKYYADMPKYQHRVDVAEELLGHIQEMYPGITEQGTRGLAELREFVKGAKNAPKEVLAEAEALYDGRQPRRPFTEFLLAERLNASEELEAVEGGRKRGNVEALRARLETLGAIVSMIDSRIVHAISEQLIGKKKKQAVQEEIEKMNRGMDPSRFAL